MPDNVSPLLEVNLLSKVQASNGIMVLECNFDSTLLILYEEMRFWYRLGFAMPPCATEMTPKEERLRVFRENVALVVRDYNHIVNLLSPVCAHLLSAIMCKWWMLMPPPPRDCHSICYHQTV